MHSKVVSGEELHPGNGQRRDACYRKRGGQPHPAPKATGCTVAVPTHLGTEGTQKGAQGPPARRGANAKLARLHYSKHDLNKT